MVGIYCNLMTKANVLRMIGGLPRRPERPWSSVDPSRRTTPRSTSSAGADVVVVGEGELTLEELLPRLLARPGGERPGRR